MVETFSAERERLQREVQCLNQANMDIRETAEARERQLEEQMENLKIALDREECRKHLLLQECDELKIGMNCLEYEKENFNHEIEAAREENKHLIAEAVDRVKVF